MQHGHEVRLAGTERTMQVSRLGRLTVQSRPDQTKGLVEVVQQPLGDDVFGERTGAALLGHRLGELQDEVGGGDGRLDVDDVTEQRRLSRWHGRVHSSVVFLAARRPRFAAVGRQARRSSSVSPCSPWICDRYPAKKAAGDMPYSASNSPCHCPSHGWSSSSPARNAVSSSVVVVWLVKYVVSA